MPLNKTNCPRPGLQQAGTVCSHERAAESLLTLFSGFSPRVTWTLSYCPARAQITCSPGAVVRL